MRVRRVRARPRIGGGRQQRRLGLPGGPGRHLHCNGLPPGFVPAILSAAALPRTSIGAAAPLALHGRFTPRATVGTAASLLPATLTRRAAIDAVPDVAVRVAQ
jgi:hypothetical protein